MRGCRSYAPLVRRRIASSLEEMALIKSSVTALGDRVPLYVAMRSRRDLHVDATAGNSDIGPSVRRSNDHFDPILIFHGDGRRSACNGQTGAAGVVMTIKIFEVLQIVDFSGRGSAADADLA